MLKEIHEQPKVVQRTLEGRLGDHQVLVQAFGPQAAELFAKVRNVQIVACGTSYHAGMVARYWLEELAGIPCQIERSEEHTSELQSLMRTSYAVFCLKKK